MAPLVWVTNLIALTNIDHNNGNSNFRFTQEIYQINTNQVIHNSTRGYMVTLCCNPY